VPNIFGNNTDDVIKAENFCRMYLSDGQMPAEYMSGSVPPECPVDWVEGWEPHDVSPEAGVLWSAVCHGKSLLVGAGGETMHHYFRKKKVYVFTVSGPMDINIFKIKSGKQDKGMVLSCPRITDRCNTVARKAAVHHTSACIHHTSACIHHTSACVSSSGAE
jgi:hypothetical protein